MRERIRCQAIQGNGYQCGLRAVAWVRRPSGQGWAGHARCRNHAQHWVTQWPIQTGDPVVDLARATEPQMDW